MSEYGDKSREIDLQEVNLLAKKIDLNKHFLESPKEERLEIINQVLTLMEKFLTTHRYTDPDEEKIIYIPGEDDVKLFKIYEKISGDIGELHYEEPQRRDEIAEELELAGIFLLRMDSNGLQDYRAAVEKRIKFGPINA